MKEGFKQTEIGIIPTDWTTKSYGEIFTFLKTATFSRSELADNEDVFCLHYGDIHTKLNNFLDLSKCDLSSVSLAKAKRYTFLADGDVIVVDASEDYDGIGKSVEVKNLGTRKAISGLHTFLLRDTNGDLANGYRAYLHSNQFIRKQFDKLATGMKVFGVTKTNLKTVQIPLPPVPEQEAIAEVLGDVDALITSLDEFIEKKRNIKQGAMQLLLTGKKRLAGFSDKWETKTLAEIGQFRKGKGIRKDSVISDGLPCIRYGEIYTSHSDFIREFNSFISVETAGESQLLLNGDLLFAGSGETAEEIGKCVAYIGTDEAYAGGDIIILSPHNADSLFLGFLLNQHYVAKQKSKVAQGDAVVHIYPSGLSRVEVRIPTDVNEQTAIGKVLREMDTAIESLELQRYKNVSIKQGMMQELLTGKTRLV